MAPPCPPHAAPPRDTLLGRFARTATDWSGTSAAFGLAGLTILARLAVGLVFGYADTWQLVINTGTTIVTLLMVFLILRAQNEDARAVHPRRNERVAAMRGASNRLINVEDLTEAEVRTRHQHYCALAELAQADRRLTQSHSVEEAEERHNRKAGRGG